MQPFQILFPILRAASYRAVLKSVHLSLCHRYIFSSCSAASHNLVTDRREINTYVSKQIAHISFIYARIKVKYLTNKSEMKCDLGAST